MTKLMVEFFNSEKEKNEINPVSKTIQHFWPTRTVGGTVVRMKTWDRIVVYYKDVPGTEIDIYTGIDGFTTRSPEINTGVIGRFNPDDETPESEGQVAKYINMATIIENWDVVVGFIGSLNEFRQYFREYLKNLEQ